jgi:hypothetical protein
MLCDTLSDVPDSACNALWINELIFGQLRNFVGPVFSGGASQAFGGGDAEWGRAIQLAEHETLELRIFPKGVLSSGKLIEMRNMIIMIAARRRGPVGKDHVTFGILWHPDQEIDIRFSAFDSMLHTTQTVSARNLHIVCPSLFNHHDAHFIASQSFDGKKPVCVQHYPVLDQTLHHAVRPSTYSVHRMVKIPGGQVIKTVTAAPGLSQFVLGGHFGGVEVEDTVHPSCMQIKHGDWTKMVENFTNKIQERGGFNAGLSAMHNSMALTDLLTGEGLLGILGHSFSGGALPDMLHSPGGFPLLIAFMTRIACYPSRYRLPEGTATDQLANRELVSMFEANWAPIHPEKAGSRNIYAIDLAIRQAHTDARVAAKKTQQTEAPVDDNLTFWHRAGQRCVTALFGPQVEDFMPPRANFGISHRVIDPLMEARDSVLQKQLNATEAVTGTDSRISLHLASIQEKRSVLLMVLNSVEHWLRTGTYCGLQLHQKRATDTIGSRLFRPGTGKNEVGREHLRQALDRGVEDSVREAMATGNCISEAHARAQAIAMKEGIESALNFDANGRVNLSDLRLNMPKEVIDASIPKLKANAAKHHGDANDPLKGIVLTDDDVSEGAFEHAINCISASMCQGAMVHHDFNMSCFLCSPNAVNTCADCDAEVHMLSAAFLGTRYGSCVRCHRPRCIPCTALMHSKGKPTALNPHDTTRPCKRCKPTTPAAPTAPTVDPSAPAAPSAAPAPPASNLPTGRKSKTKRNQ